MSGFEGRTALVTGATGGLGQAIAETLVKNGVRVAISGTRQEALDAMAKELGNDTLAFACDLRDPASIQEMADKAEEALGKVDILVCNAGITRDTLALRMKDEDWDDVISINLTSNFKLVRALLKGMFKRRYGRIISISSVSGIMGNAGQVNYSASKAGLIGMTKSLAKEVASRGITVNCVAPGFIHSAMTEKLPEDQVKFYTANIPAGRFGEPQEVADAVLFLAAPGAGYITGQTLNVNGGIHMV